MSNDKKLTVKSDIDEACVYIEIDGEGVRVSKEHFASPRKV